MGFLDDLSSVSNEARVRDSSIALLHLLAKGHEKILLDRHLKSDFDGLKREITNAVSAGNYEELDGKKFCVADIAFRQLCR